MYNVYVVRASLKGEMIGY